MQYWLVKTEPGDYSFEDLMKDKETPWDGVRNYQARNNLKLMEPGDAVLVYHSVKQKEVVGLAKVTAAFFQDPTTDDDRWVAVQLAADKPLTHPVSLAQIKAEPSLSEIALVRNSRLSVMPLEKGEFETIIALSEEA